MPLRPEPLEGVGIDEKLGQSIDLDLTFVAENGRPVTLRQYFEKGRPVILNLVYYSCPMLCNLILNGQTAMLREIPWTPGEQFEVVTVSIDPTEQPDLAKSKKALYLESFERPAPGWHFLVDYDGNVKKLADQVGFRYKFDERQQQYAHAAAIMVLTPEGKISRYLYGIRFKARDVRLAITEASEGKFGSTVDKLLLLCFHYDAAARSYVVFAGNIMRIGGALVVLALAFMLYRLWRGERHRFAPPQVKEDLVTAK
ncbi:MAG: SCO family protein [Bryobacteraceae bacterium]|nr:SCO family protein [Bryobacteraceae bacterium]